VSAVTAPEITMPSPVSLIVTNLAEDKDGEDGPLPLTMLEKRNTNNSFYRRFDGGYTLSAKRKIVDKAYPPEGPKRVRKMAKEFGIHHSTVVYWKRLFDTLSPSINADGNDEHEEESLYT
jgi:hypothetical protein